MLEGLSELSGLEWAQVLFLLVMGWGSVWVLSAFTYAIGN